MSSSIILNLTRISPVFAFIFKFISIIFIAIKINTTLTNTIKRNKRFENINNDDLNKKDCEGHDDRDYNKNRDYDKRDQKEKNSNLNLLKN